MWKTLLWNVKAGTYQIVNDYLTEKQFIDQAVLSPNGKLVAVSIDWKIIIWDVAK